PPHAAPPTPVLLRPPARRAPRHGSSGTAQRPAGPRAAGFRPISFARTGPSRLPCPCSHISWYDKAYPMIYSTCTAQRTRPNLPHIALLKGSSASETACVLTAHRVARAVPLHAVPQD